MKKNNKDGLEGFFIKVFNIQDKKIPKISLFFIIAIVFEFLVALPIYSFLSKKIGATLLIVVLLVFFSNINLWYTQSCKVLFEQKMSIKIIQ